MATSGWQGVKASDISTLQAKAAKPSKYRNVKVTVDGITFDSKREAARYHELKLMEKAGLIRDLVLQPRFRLDVGAQSADPALGFYIADFSYVDVKTEEVFIEDVKGFDTPLSKWKRKHTKMQYGVTVHIIS